MHLLIENPPRVAVPTLVSSLKSVLARRLRVEFTGRVNRQTTHGHFWSPSYLAVSCRAAPLSIIPKLIEQRRHPLTRPPGSTPLNGGACVRQFQSAHPGV